MKPAATPSIEEIALQNFPGTANARVRDLICKPDKTPVEHREFVAWACFPGEEGAEARELFLKEWRTPEDEAVLRNLFEVLRSPTSITSPTGVVYTGTWMTRETFISKCIEEGISCLQKILAQTEGWEECAMQFGLVEKYVQDGWITIEQLKMTSTDFERARELIWKTKK